MNAPLYFFCGIGGSGMRPLAEYLRAGGHTVAGSDRSFDQGRFPDLADRLRGMGVGLFPQDGSGLTSSDQVLVTSSAVEATIPDVAAAQDIGARQMIRAELLAELTNGASTSCGVAGTSGKSTTTGMLAHLLSETGRDPSVVNGAVMLGKQGTNDPAQGWRRGASDLFVAEVDESDGSIARYNPSVGVITNVSEDHKTMDELEALFGGYAERSKRAVLGIDSEPVALIAEGLPPEKIVTFSLGARPEADFVAHDIRRDGGFLTARIEQKGGEPVSLRLPLIGRFNVANALAALAAGTLLGVPLAEGAPSLVTFGGTARRLQHVGSHRGVTVIDDFAHNPDKIGASLKTLTDHFSRVFLVYQPHGYGPLRSFRPLYEAAFADALRPVDSLLVTEPAYFGGTVEKTDDAKRLVQTLADQSFQVTYAENREAFRSVLTQTQERDAVVVMGARDDSLSDFARSLLADLSQGEVG
ncbi:MAG: Mur ligase family protein [Pseudomonadota bacterium]